MATEHEEFVPQLAPGVGFILEGDGRWDVQNIPPDVVKSAEFDGYLTIQGYECSVFITPDGQQWAQKVSGTPAPKGDNDLVHNQASLERIAARIVSKKYRPN